MTTASAKTSSISALTQRALSLPKGGAIRVPFDASRPTNQDRASI